MKVSIRRACLLAAIGILAAVSIGVISATAQNPAEKVMRAVAVLHPTAGNDVSGTVTFTQVADGVQISADIENLTPGKHGFHIHELGDCTAADATSAGGHYNPDAYPHAGPQSKQRHMGDLGNLEADTFGRAHYERLDSYVTLNGPKSIIGRGVIVHADEDDLKTQPTGAAGARQACGVIGISHP
jgi:Cu-Zn family superoxide dismutase